MTYAGVCLLITCYGLQKRTPHDMRERGEREIQRGRRRAGGGYWHVDEACGSD